MILLNRQPDRINCFFQWSEKFIFQFIKTVVCLSKQKPDDHIEIKINPDKIDGNEGDQYGQKNTSRDIGSKLWNNVPFFGIPREGGSHTYIVNGKTKYLLKVIGSAFSDTARQSVSIMRYLEENGFPVSSAAKKFFLFHTGSRSGIFSYRPQSLRYTVWIA